MAAKWMVGLVSVLAACMIHNAVCNEEPDELQDTDTQTILDLTNNFASILQSLTKLEKPHEEALRPQQFQNQKSDFWDQNTNWNQDQSWNQNQNQDQNQNQTPIPLDARDCNDVAAYNSNNNLSSGIYMLKPYIYPVSKADKDVKSFAAYCDMVTDGGNWTVIHRRSGPLVGFYRDWVDYKNGFGFLDGDHWLGLERLHQMTVHFKYELRIELEDFLGNLAYAKYDNFQIGDEFTDYTLILGAFNGTAEDSFSYHHGKRFSTRDKDHDDNIKGSCALEYLGAWWYGNCHLSNLNGKYPINKAELISQGSATAKNYDVGMTWFLNNRYILLKSAQMKIRRVA